MSKQVIFAVLVLVIMATIVFSMRKPKQEPVEELSIETIDAILALSDEELIAIEELKPLTTEEQLAVDSFEGLTQEEITSLDAEVILSTEELATIEAGITLTPEELIVIEASLSTLGVSEGTDSEGTASTDLDKRREVAIKKAKSDKLDVEVKKAKDEVKKGRVRKAKSKSRKLSLAKKVKKKKDSARSGKKKSDEKKLKKEEEKTEKAKKESKKATGEAEKKEKKVKVVSEKLTLLHEKEKSATGNEKKSLKLQIGDLKKEERIGREELQKSVKTAEKAKKGELKQIGNETIVKIETLKARHAGELKDLEDESVEEITVSSEQLTNNVQNSDVSIVVSEVSGEVEKETVRPDLSSEKSLALRKFLPLVLKNMTADEKIALNLLSEDEKREVIRTKSQELQNDPNTVLPMKKTEGEKMAEGPTGPISLSNDQIREINVHHTDILSKMTEDEKKALNLLPQAEKQLFFAEEIKKINMESEISTIETVSLGSWMSQF